MDSMTIRQKFLDYFAARGHRVVRSSSLVPANDPTLYFTNAGMVQFKDVFVGQEHRDYRRACSSQKCLRVSGKQNDLESVGRTSRHHTFFEMLGNFSFGDYFKKEAIHFAWEFLTREVGLPAERLSASVFAGEDNVPPDDEAHAVWQREIGLPEQRIFRLGVKDNFWAMGDSGPCGPCSEVHYHQGDHLPCPEPTCLGVACECDRWVEVWNLVFMQFDLDAGGRLTPLAATGVDTGMGLERLVAVVQGVPSTYDTDLLRPLLTLLETMSGHPYGSDPRIDISLRVVADHARAAAFCIADGVFPEKGGREYVLRRIMRRAIRHGKKLGFEEPFFDQVCTEVVRLMGPVFPELTERASVIETITRAEEAAFRRTLNRGLQKLQRAMETAQSSSATTLDEAFVGDLYATDGFPIDLTRLIAEEQGLAVDEEAAHKWVLRVHGAADSRVGEEAVPPVYKELLEAHGPTAFLGHDTLQGQGSVLALLDGQGRRLQKAGKGQKLELITDATPLYGRSGGQVGDAGIIEGPAGAKVVVHDTLKPGGQLIVHLGEVVQGTLAVGDAVTLRADEMRRQAIRSNHSATHLLHRALREILGEHVAQKGSEVTPDHLRFDFSHFEGLSAETMQKIERQVNGEIRRNAASRTEVKPLAEAQKQGAMALFGERYGETVRVVHIGTRSVELCGGTHVACTGEIGLFKLVSEEALALGVRRILAVTGQAALELVQQTEARLQEVAALLRCAPEQVRDRVEKQQAELRELEQEVATLRRRLAVGGTDLMERVREVKGIKVLASRVEAADPRTLREAGDTLRDRLGSGLVVLGGEHNGKATVLVMVTPDLTRRLHAGQLVGELCKLLDGRGGGRPEMAQGGGPRLDKLDEALQRVPELI